MKVLLDEDEISFLDKTKEETEEYTHNDLINRMLMICTKRKMKRNNFVSNFNNFAYCIRTKMLKLAGSDKYGIGNGLFAQQESETSISEFIDKSQITKAILKGYAHLEPIIERMAKENKKDLEKYENLKEMAFICALIVIARANIEFKFTN